MERFKKGASGKKVMDIKNYLTAFELTSERERKIFRNIAHELSNLYDSTKQLYNRTPAIVRAGALIGLGVLGTLAYQKATELAEPEQKVWISYHHGGTGDAKDRPYDYSGFVTKEGFEMIQANRYIKINDVEFGRE